jgi:hypothetical protein
VSITQIYTLHHLLRLTYYILFSDIHTILSSQIYTHILFRLTHNIHFKEIYSTQKCTLYPLLSLTLYILFTEMHIISFSRKSHFILITETHLSSSQINTINPQQINTIRRFRRYTQCIYYLLKQTRCILFSDIQTILSSHYIHISSQKNTLYFHHANAYYILFTELHNITSSQKNTLYPPYHYIRF